MAADGGVRDGVQVTEPTGLLALIGLPNNARAAVRRERPHPGAHLSLFEERNAGATPRSSHRPGWCAAVAKRPHRAPTGVHDRIRCAKDTACVGCHHASSLFGAARRRDKRPATILSHQDNPQQSIGVAGPTAPPSHANHPG